MLLSFLFMLVNSNKIACIGAGYVGGPTMAVMALKAPHLEIRVCDINKSRIDAWNSDHLPIYEPGLDEIIKECRGRNLFFTTDVAKAIKECDIIFVSVNTPTKKAGIGAGAAADLCYWEACARSIAEHSEGDKIIIEKSTVPVRTAEAVQRILAGCGSNHKFVVCSNPEFLAEGTAIKDLFNPDRVLVGAPQTPIGLEAQKHVVNLYRNWVSPDKILSTNVWSSELSKLAANAFLAQRVSSINAIGMLCTRTGADVREVSRAIGMDSRIGPKFLNASVGFGGSCFQKDILNLVYLCESAGLSEVAEYWRQVVKMNDLSKSSFAHDIIRNLFNTVRNKNIAVLGVAFKKDTGDVRETAALDICRVLLEDGAIIRWYDAKVEMADILFEFECHGLRHLINDKNFIKCETALEASKGSDAIAILTEWDEFKTLDYKSMYEVMRKPAALFDGRNITDHESIAKIGFEVHRIGNRPLVRKDEDDLRLSAIAF